MASEDQYADTRLRLRQSMVWVGLTLAVILASIFVAPQILTDMGAGNGAGAGQTISLLMGILCIARVRYIWRNGQNDRE